MGKTTKIFILFLLLVQPAMALDVTLEDAGDQIPSSTGLYGRDGAFSAVVGNTVLWIHGDTFAKGALLTNMIAWSTLDDPTHLYDFVDGNDIPIQFIPFTREEREYNEAHGNVPDNRIGLWPLKMVPISKTAAKLFFLRLIITGPLNYQFLGIQVARLSIHEREDGTRRLRVRRDKKNLFEATEPLFGDAMFKMDSSSNPLLYIMSPAGHLGKAQMSRLNSRRHWLFWTGSQWVSDVNLAKSIPNGIGSVAWNSTLQKYVSLRTWFFFNNQMYIRTADRLEGPWSAEQAVPISTSSYSYMFQWHPEFTKDGAMLLTYNYTGPLHAFDLRTRMIYVKLLGP